MKDSLNHQSLPQNLYPPPKVHSVLLPHFSNPLDVDLVPTPSAVNPKFCFFYVPQSDPRAVASKETHLSFRGDKTRISIPLDLLVISHTNSYVVHTFYRIWEYLSMLSSEMTVLAA
jgi:hypothetical protein